MEVGSEQQYNQVDLYGQDDDQDEKRLSEELRRDQERTNTSDDIDNATRPDSHHQESILAPFTNDLRKIAAEARANPNRPEKHTPEANRQLAQFTQGEISATWLKSKAEQPNTPSGHENYAYWQSNNAIDPIAALSQGELANDNKGQQNSDDVAKQFAQRDLGELLPSSGLARDTGVQVAENSFASDLGGIFVDAGKKAFVGALQEKVEDALTDRFTSGITDTKKRYSGLDSDSQKRNLASRLNRLGDNKDPVARYLAELPYKTDADKEQFAARLNEIIGLKNVASDKRDFKFIGQVVDAFPNNPKAISNVLLESMAEPEVKPVNPVTTREEGSQEIKFTLNGTESFTMNGKVYPMSELDTELNKAKAKRINSADASAQLLQSVDKDQRGQVYKGLKWIQGLDQEHQFAAFIKHAHHYSPSENKLAQILGTASGGNVDGAKATAKLMNIAGVDSSKVADLVSEVNKLPKDQQAAAFAAAVAETIPDNDNYEGNLAEVLTTANPADADKIEALAHQVANTKFTSSDSNSKGDKSTDKAAEELTGDKLAEKRGYLAKSIAGAAKLETTANRFSGYLSQLPSFEDVVNNKVVSAKGIIKQRAQQAHEASSQFAKAVGTGAKDGLNGTGGTIVNMAKEKTENGLNQLEQEAGRVKDKLVIETAKVKDSLEGPDGDKKVFLAMLKQNKYNPEELEATMQLGVDRAAAKDGNPLAELTPRQRLQIAALGASTFAHSKKDDFAELVSAGSQSKGSDAMKISPQVLAAAKNIMDRMSVEDFRSLGKIGEQMLSSRSTGEFLETFSANSNNQGVQKMVRSANDLLKENFGAEDFENIRGHLTPGVENSLVDANGNIDPQRVNSSVQIATRGKAYGAVAAAHAQYGSFGVNLKSRNEAISEWTPGHREKAPSRMRSRGYRGKERLREYNRNKAMFRDMDAGYSEGMNKLMPKLNNMDQNQKDRLFAMQTMLKIDDRYRSGVQGFTPTAKSFQSLEKLETVSSFSTGTTQVASTTGSRQTASNDIVLTDIEQQFLTNFTMSQVGNDPKGYVAKYREGGFSIKRDDDQFYIENDDNGRRFNLVKNNHDNRSGYTHDWVEVAGNIKPVQNHASVNNNYEDQYGNLARYNNPNSSTGDQYEYFQDGDTFVARGKSGNVKDVLKVWDWKIKDYRVISNASEAQYVQDRVAMIPQAYATRS